MKTFDELWRTIKERANNHCFPVVQDYDELEYIFNLIQGCNSYLEVGTAEGDSLYVLSHALADDAKIVSVDLGEKHTIKYADEVEAMAKREIKFIRGNSHDIGIINQAYGEYDVVLIDAGHQFVDVIADAMVYGAMADKYIIFHDVMLPEVRQAFGWYCNQRKGCKNYIVSNSDNFGYGIIEI